MSLKMVFCRNLQRSIFSILLLLLFYSESSYAQCAGADAAITICNVSDPANKTINLFSLLGPGAQPGGTWNNPSQTLAFNPLTSILNAWNIRLSGTYTFVYTVNDPLCADNTSTVTVTIGPFAGVPTAGVACDDDSSFNLFHCFDGTNNPSPQFGGVWTDDSNTGALSGNFLNATLTQLGTFNFTYTIPAVGPCIASQQTVSVTVYPAPKPGIPSHMNYCENDDFSGLTNVNLFDHLTGQDAGGTWSDSGGTSEISGFNDSTINIQNIFNTQGAGEYSFTYTVLPINTICIPKTATVNLKIIKLIDLTGGTVTVNSDICEERIGLESFQVVLTQGIKPVPNGNYTLHYSIAGPNPLDDAIAGVTFENGIAAFNLSPDDVNLVGNYTITITAIKLSTDPGICDNIAGIFGTLDIFPSPNIGAANLDIGPVCQNSGATVTISGIASLAPGNYELTYGIVGANQASNQTVTITATGSAVTFNIPATLFSNVGSSTLIISKIVNLTTGCTKTITLQENFVVRPLPDLSNLAVTVGTVCQNQAPTVNVSGLGTMTSVSIIYNLSGANTATAQTVSLTASGGSGTFQIPGNLLPNAGSTSVEITIVVNTVTTCSSPANIGASFLVTALPDAANIGVSIGDTCKNQPVSVFISGLDATPSVSITYSLSGANTATQTTIVTPNSGNAVFVIQSGLLPNAGTTMFTLTSIANTVTNCQASVGIQDSFEIYPVPNVNAFAVSVPSVCQNQPVSVLFSNLGTESSLTFSYNLNGANTATAQTVTINVDSGAAVFVIPASLLPNTGVTSISIFDVSVPVTNCSIASSITRSFTINPLPNPVVISLSIPDTCKNLPVVASFSGFGNVSGASFTYDLSGANTATSQSATLVVSGGNSMYVIPAGLLPNSGDTTLVVTSLTFTQSNCSVPVTTVTDSFRILDLPAAPIVSDVSFCKAQNATVTNLLPNGLQYKWYATNTSTVELASDTPLVSGNYYVSETGSATGCSSPRAVVGVSIVELQPPVLNANGQNFCGANNPTLLDLTNKTTSDEQVVWYDAQQNGTVLPDTTLLQEGQTYYGFQFSDAINCLSESGLSVTVSLTDCDDDDDDDFFIPDGFSPNNDTVNDTFKIPDIEFLYPDYTLEIYNRYGSLLFKGNKSKPAWDGRSSQSGNLIDGIAPNGVYFYVINFNKNNKSPKQGRLYLNR